MFSKSRSWIFVLCLCAFTFHSCTEDSDIISVDDAELNELRNGNNNQNGQGGNGPGQGGNPNGGMDLDDLDNDLLVDWNDVFVRIDRYAYGMRPNATARAIAYINLAVYETALPAMRRYRSNTNRLNGFQVNRNILEDDISMEIALNTCYANMLHHFMINVSNNAKDEIDLVEAALEAQFSNGLSQTEISNSRAWGDYISQQVISYSATDTDAETQILTPQPTSYVPPTGNGYWTFSAEPERALFPYWGSTRTFVISSDETTSIPPLSYSTNSNSEYFEQMMEVYSENNEAKQEQNDQLWIAEFWSDDVEGLMLSPPGRQVSIANQLILQNNLDLEEAIVLMLKLGFSLNDAAVSVWADKYEYMVMRPNVYIEEFIDDEFETNLFRLVYWPNPSFPGYPSGHSTFASAAAGVFIDEFGNNENFTDKTHEGRTEFLGAPRSYQKLSDMAKENAYSRIPLGVHVRMDCDEGYRLGYEIADAVNDLNILRNNN